MRTQPKLNRYLNHRSFRHVAAVFIAIAALWMGATPNALRQAHAARPQGARLMVSATVVEICHLVLPTDRRFNANAKVLTCGTNPLANSGAASTDLLSRSLFNTEVDEQLGVITLTF